MPVLPACVRLSLWVTDAWARDRPLDAALTAALPDVDAVGGDVDRLATWHDLGERALLVALPRPGDVSGMPSAPVESLGAATEAGECLVAPTFGGLLVPTLSSSGPAGSPLDQVHRLDLTAYPSDPVARHRVEMLDVRLTRRLLTERVLETATTLERTGGAPFAGWGARRERDDAWGLPPGLGGDVLSAMTLAATLWDATLDGLDAAGDILTATTHDVRTRTLRELAAYANEALAEATNVGVAQLAGWVPVR